MLESMIYVSTFEQYLCAWVMELNFMFMNAPTSQILCISGKFTFMLILPSPDLARR